MRPTAYLFAVFCVFSVVHAQEGDVRGVHDPSIIKDGEFYYIYTTSLPNELGMPVRRSRDLFNWKVVGDVFETFPKWVADRNPQHRNLWAPHVAKWDGTFHLYYSVSDFGTNRSALALATNETLDVMSDRYSWKDMGPVITTEPGRDDWNAIDPCIAEDSSGNPWLILGSYWQGVKGMKLDKRTGKLSAERKIYDLASRHGGPIEAPYVVKHNGFYYLFVSFDHCCKGVDSDYKTMVGRSRNLMGPYVDCEGTDMNDGGGSLVLSGGGNVIGPGHNSVLEEDGGDWFVHHYYDASHKGVPTLQIRPLHWLPSGWPVVGEPMSGPLTKKADHTFVMPGVWEHRVNYEDVGHRIRFEANHTLAGGAAKWKLSGNQLTMQWRKPDGEWIDTCVLASDGASYVGRNQAGAVISGKKITP